MSSSDNVAEPSSSRPTPL